MISKVGVGDRGFPVKFGWRHFGDNTFCGTVCLEEKEKAEAKKRNDKKGRQEKNIEVEEWRRKVPNYPLRSNKLKTRFYEGR